MIGTLHAQSNDAAAADAATHASTSTPAAGSSSDCSTSLFDRLTAAYHEDAHPAPADPNAPTTARRAMESPFSSPPFPSGGVAARRRRVSDGCAEPQLAVSARTCALLQQLRPLDAGQPHRNLRLGERVGERQHVEQHQLSIVLRSTPEPRRIQPVPAAYRGVCRTPCRPTISTGVSTSTTCMDTTTTSPR